MLTVASALDVVIVTAQPLCKSDPDTIREMPPGPGGTGTASVTLDSLGPVTPGPPARLTVSSCRGGGGRAS